MSTISVRRYERTGRCYVRLEGREYNRITRQRVKLSKRIRKNGNRPEKAANQQIELDRILSKERVLVSFMEIREEDIPEGSRIRSLYRKPERVIQPEPELYRQVLIALEAQYISPELYQALDQTQYPVSLNQPEQTKHKRYASL